MLCFANYRLRIPSNPLTKQRTLLHVLMLLSVSSSLEELVMTIDLHKHTLHPLIK